MTEYGFADWEGNDRHFMGWAGTGVHFDPIIASNAASWLRANAATLDEPWFLTVALVNPHDVMWFPIDQPVLRRRAPRRRRARRARCSSSRSGRKTTFCRCSPTTTTKCATSCPPNFGDDLLDKPDAQRQWRWDQQHGLWGYIDPSDKKSWLRHLDYYVKLQQMADVSLGTVMSRARGERRVRRHDRDPHLRPRRHVRLARAALEGPVRVRGDHARAVRVKVPGVTQAGSQTAALGTHVDLASTIVSLGGVDPATQPSLQGVDLSPVLADPSASVRDHVLFAHDTAHTNRINNTRYAIRGFFDGRTKYARYYGVGGGKPGTGLWGKDPGRKLYDVDAAFADQEHEWYDLREDPHEMVNLAHDRGRRAELHANYERLLEYEAAEFA